MSNIQQQTDEWYKWRLLGIGSSEAPAIMGESPYATAFQVYQRKLELIPEQEENWGMRQGKENEGRARALYELKHTMEMPADLCVHPEYSYIRASLDGWNKENKIILEIKCPDVENHAEAKAGKIPKKYLWQVVHQMLASGAETAHYWSYHLATKDTQLVEFKKDLKLEAQLLKACTKFWIEHRIPQIPPELSDRDFKVIKTPPLVALMEKFKQAKAAYEEQERILSEAKKEIISLIGEARVQCNGVRIMPVTRKGSVEYGRVPELSGVDLEPYRKPSTTYVDIRITKEKPDA